MFYEAADIEESTKSVHIMGIPDMPNWTAIITLDLSSEFLDVVGLRIRPAFGEEITSVTIRKIKVATLQRRAIAELKGYKSINDVLVS